MATTSLSTPALRVNLLDLAAAAVACTVGSSRAIRRIQSSQNARLKQDGSFVTDADYAAQGVIVQAIRAVSPAVRIVGEESSEEMAKHIHSDNEDDSNSAFNEDLLQRARNEIRLLYHRHHLQSQQEEIQAHRLPLAQGPLDASSTDAFFSSLPDDPDDCFVDPSRVSVIVDPLDGTKSYTRGEYDAVSILIAIVLDNIPCFGVIGKPFGYPSLSSILDSGCATVYGGTLLQAVYVAGGRRIVPTPVTADRRAVISGSRSHGVVYDFCHYLGQQQGLIHPEPMPINGAGEKALRLILHDNGEALWFFPKPGTSRWDVAAPDAILRVLNGKLTDKYGEDMDYSDSLCRENAENTNGLVACIDADLHQQCIQLFQQGDWLNQS
jgi:3'-phosphoadenosine 5'-phosphosulfate (PAPS) 3'-phosphatase